MRIYLKANDYSTVNKSLIEISKKTTDWNWESTKVN